MDMAQEHVDDLIDAYALGALEPAEVERVERHLDGCAACQELLDSARAVTDDLLVAVPPAAPPLALRARVLDRIRAEKVAAEREATPRSTTPPNAPDDPGVASVAGEPPDAEGGSRRRGLGHLLRTLFGGEPQAEEAAASRLLRDLLLDPDVVIVPVARTESAAADAGARLVTAPARREGVILAHGLHPLDAQHAYQVWLLRGGATEPNALFHVGRTGRGAGIVRHVEPLLDFDVVAVTPEPAGGSQTATGPIVLAGEIRPQLP